MHILLVVLFWLVVGIIWGLLSGVMDHMNFLTKKFVLLDLRLAIGAVAGFAAAWALFRGLPGADSKLTILWVLESVTIAQLLRNFVRNKLS